MPTYSAVTSHAHPARHIATKNDGLRPDLKYHPGSCGIVATGKVLWHTKKMPNQLDEVLSGLSGGAIVLFETHSETAPCTLQRATEARARFVPGHEQLVANDGTLDLVQHSSVPVLIARPQQRIRN